MFATRYEFIHNRANHITPKEQTQVNEMIYYASTLLPHLHKKLLEKLSFYHRPKSLKEAIGVTMGFEVEHQITQPELDLVVMETCYQDPESEETYTTEEVQTRSQTQNKVRISKETNLHSRNNNTLDRRISKKVKTNQLMDPVTNLSTTRETTSIMVTRLSIRDKNNTDQIKDLS